MMDATLEATELPHRYAVYFAPDSASPWWRLGSEWLGRDARSGAAINQPTVAGVTGEELAALTAAPRRYGWHATLKAPFVLAPHASMSALRAALHSVCEELQPFPMPTLRVRKVDDFFALVAEPEPNQSVAHEALQEIAALCVTDLNPFAATLSASEFARRSKEGLTSEQSAHLMRWGYPFVLDQFRFHMSLTGSLKRSSQLSAAAVLDAARNRFEGLPPARFESITLFAEPAPGSDFVVVEDFAFGK